MPATRLPPQEYFGANDAATLVQRLGERLGHTFSRPEAALQALVHRSLQSIKGQPVASNERLEFLGDGVANWLVVEELYRLHPDWDEGALSRRKSQVVCTASWARCARDLGLGELLQMGWSAESVGARDRDNILEDLFEACLGALYLDGGIEAVRSLLQRVLFPTLEQVGESAAYANWKGQLNEQLQAAKRPVAQYRVVAVTGPDHARAFMVEAVSGADVLSAGEGSTKLKAEQAAARVAVERLGHADHAAHLADATPASGTNSVLGGRP
jgi:ribonuclease-3